MIGFNPNPMPYFPPCCWQPQPMPWSGWAPPTWMPSSLPPLPPCGWDFPACFDPYQQAPRELPAERTYGPTSGNAHLAELRRQEKLLRSVALPGHLAPSELTVSTRTLLDNFEAFDTAAGLGGGQDGIIGRPDLEAVANDNGADPALRKAARFMLNNEALRRAVDSANGTGYDDRFNREELQKTLETFGNHLDSWENRPWDDRRTASVLSKWVRVLDGAAGGEVDGKFGRADLQAILESPDASWELRQAASRVLGSQTLAHRLDSANGALDGVYADGDLQRVINP